MAGEVESFHILNICHQVHRHSGAEPYSLQTMAEEAESFHYILAARFTDTQVLNHQSLDICRGSGVLPYILAARFTDTQGLNQYIQTIHGRRSRVLLFIDASIGSQTCTQVLNRGSLDRGKGSVALICTLLSQTLSFSLGQYYSAEETESSIYLPQGSVTNAKADTFDLLHVSRAKEAESFHLSASRFTRHQFNMQNC